MPIKLSPAQQIVVDKMRDNWSLRCTANGYWFLSDNTLLRRIPPEKKVNAITVRALGMKNVIYPSEARIHNKADGLSTWLLNREALK